MEIRFTDHGIYLPPLDLWLDGTQPCETTWISHGHADHARGKHDVVIGTEPSLQVFRARWEGFSDPEFRPLGFGQSLMFRGARLTAYPASHILGAAQLLIEYEGERVVYTGDIKLRTPLCGDTTEIVPCDRIIIESTFGLPIFRFLNREQAREKIVAFAEECLRDGDTPVFIGYALGRGQEIVHTLCAAGLPVAVHGAIARLIPIYEQRGFRFPGWVPYAARETAGKALVVVPSFRNVLEASGKNFRLAYVSGWASMDNARARTGAEELIPYSDHGDFEELLKIVTESGAREVDVVHGYTGPFAHILRQRGLEARCPKEAAGRGEEEEGEG